MDHRVTHVIKRMHQDLHTDLSLEALAAEVGLSVSRLAYLFRQQTRISPGAFLHALRMDRARMLVESTTLSVRDVMVQVGLSDPSHFARDFRNAHGLSPRAYRLQLRLAGPPARYRNGAGSHTCVVDDSHAALPRTVDHDRITDEENQKCEKCEQ